MSTETPHHTVTARFEDGWFAEALASMKCTAPADALCHAVWDCGCEEWSDPRIEDGRPVHSVIVYDDEEDREEWHVGRFDPEFCNLREWFDNSDETLNGDVTFPVTPEWTGEGYVFNVARATQ